MAVLTEKQEQYAQAIARGVLPEDAYREIFLSKRELTKKQIREYSFEQLANPGLLKRIEELRAMSLAQTTLSLANHLDELAKLRERAMYRGHYASAISAEIARGKAAGLYVEKIEHSGEIKTRRTFADVVQSMMGGGQA